jgi:hypothetical protein
LVAPSTAISSLANPAPVGLFPLRFGFRGIHLPFSCLGRSKMLALRFLMTIFHRLRTDRAWGQNSSAHSLARIFHTSFFQAESTDALIYAGTIYHAIPKSRFVKICTATVKIHRENGFHLLDLSVESVSWSMWSTRWPIS